MNVQKLIEILKKFDPDAPVRLGFNHPGGVLETHEQLWVGDTGDGPQINAAIDLRGVQIYVGCSVPPRPSRSGHTKEIHLGRYESAEMAARVRDFYLYHQKIDEPLNFPEFDYEKWIPPRTIDGQYHPRIAEILKEKLLKE